LATYRKAEDLINIGAYVRGSNPEIDYAIDMMGHMTSFMKQGRAEQISFEESVQHLERLLN
jgi:flagellum-specific ATP synthase